MLARTPSIAAQKKRRQRQRQRAGVVVLPIEVIEDDVAAAMIASGRLSEGQALDRAALARELAGVAAEWTRRWRGKA